MVCDVCELLYFLSNKYDSHPRDSLQSVLADFYQEDKMGSEVIPPLIFVLTVYLWCRLSKEVLI